MLVVLGRAPKVLTVVAMVIGLLVAAPTVAAAAAPAPSGATCTGGAVMPGTYASLSISGPCVVVAGPVTVTGDLTVLPGASLNAAFSGPTLTVGRNVVVDASAILILGCEPMFFPCFSTATSPTNDVVGGNLTATGALMVLVHHTTIGGNLVESGGGPGVTCSDFPLGSHGPPAYSDFEDNHIGGNASIAGVATCWLGFLRNHVGQNVNFTSNANADPDGNEVATNMIGRNLNCSGDTPAPQIGDSGGALNVVGGQATDQCRSLVASST